MTESGITETTLSKRQVRTICAIVLICLGLYASFHVGAAHTCNRSRGYLLHNLVCVNYSTLRYCQINRSVYEVGNNIGFMEPRLQEILKGATNGTQ